MSDDLEHAELLVSADGQLIERYPRAEYRCTVGPVNVRLECDTGTLFLTMVQTGVTPVMGMPVWEPDAPVWVPKGSVRLTWDYRPTNVQLVIPIEVGTCGPYCPTDLVEEYRRLEQLRAAGRWRDRVGPIG